MGRTIGNDQVVINTSTIARPEGVAPPAVLAPAREKTPLDYYSAPVNPRAYISSGGFQPVILPSAEEMKGAAQIRFEQGSITSEPLVPGGKLVLLYDPKLAPQNSHNGQPFSAATATVSFEPPGKTVTKPAVCFDSQYGGVYGSGKPAPIVVDIPEGTTAVNVVIQHRGINGTTETNYPFSVSPKAE